MNIDDFKEMMLDLYCIDDIVVPNFDAIINKCVRKISEYYPYLESGSLQTVANQTRYTVTHSNLIKMKNVYYNSSTYTSVFNDPDIPDSLKRNHGVSLSQQFTDIMEHETQRRISPVDASIVSNDTFDLIPTPTAVNTVYYEYERYRTFLELPQLFEDELVSLFMFYKNDKKYQENKSVQNGNVFQFDRRGNASESAASDSKEFMEQRVAEFKLIIDEIKLKVNKLG